MSLFELNTSQKRAAAAVTAMAFGLSMAGCASSDDDAKASKSPYSPEMVTAAEKAALELAGGKELGGSLSFYIANSGDEAKVIEAAVKPFEDATGVDVKITNNTNDALVQTKVRADLAPDVVDSNSIGAMKAYADQGLLKDVGAMVGEDVMAQNFDQGLIDAATIDGTNYGVWTEVDNYMVWYNPKTYKGPDSPATWDELNTWAAGEAKAGNTPWCMAQEAGDGSGFPGAQWIENWFLKNYGPEKLTAWANGELAWSSPEVKSAFEALGAIATDETMVKGGATSVLATSFLNNGTGLISEPPTCSVMMWGVFAGALTLGDDKNLAPLEDIDFFKTPAADPAFANVEDVGGHVTYAFSDTKQVQAFIKYWASAESQSLLASSGYWTEANNAVPAAAYTNPLLSKAKETLLNDETTLATGPYLLGAADVVTAFKKAVVGYVQEPDSLDALLADLDAIQNKS
jgi:alpha-glucoside transport system substrate-binding protein